MQLKEILESKGIKQKWLAQQMEVSEVAVSNWVQGKSIPRQKNAIKLSELLNVPINKINS